LNTFTLLSHQILRKLPHLDSNQNRLYYPYTMGQNSTKN